MCDVITYKIISMKLIIDIHIIIDFLITIIIERVKRNKRSKEHLLWMSYARRKYHMRSMRASLVGWRRLGVLIKATIAFTWRSFNESEIMLKSIVGEILTKVEKIPTAITDVYTMGWLKSRQPSDNFWRTDECVGICKMNDRCIEKRDIVALSTYCYRNKIIIRVTIK